MWLKFSGISNSMQNAPCTIYHRSQLSQFSTSAHNNLKLSFLESQYISNTLCRPILTMRRASESNSHIKLQTFSRGFEQISISQSQCEQESQSNQLAGDETHSECTFWFPSKKREAEGSGVVSFISSEYQLDF